MLTFQKDILFISNVTNIQSIVDRCNFQIEEKLKANVKKVKVYVNKNLMLFFLNKNLHP